MTPPDWLTKHGGTLKLSSDGRTWYVLFAGQPQYALDVVPAAGKFTCRVKQTNNGQRLDKAAPVATTTEALAGGLEELRQTLGW
jgi:hypothetical protein